MKKKWIITIALIVIALIIVLIATNNEARESFNQGMEAGRQSAEN